MMKERFAKLLLGEDMSGSGKGVSTALAISNSITNLCGKLLSMKLPFFYALMDIYSVLFILKLPFLGNYGDSNPCPRTKNQCGEEK